jgi:hypothetical protein
MAPLDDDWFDYVEQPQRCDFELCDGDALFRCWIEYDLGIVNILILCDDHAEALEQVITRMEEL